MPWQMNEQIEYAADPNVPATLTALPLAGFDATTQTKRYDFSDSTLALKHQFLVRHKGRSVQGSAALGKGKLTALREILDADGKRATRTVSVDLTADTRFTVQQMADDIRAMGSILSRNADELAAANFTT